MGLFYLIAIAVCILFAVLIVDLLKFIWTAAGPTVLPINLLTILLTASSTRKPKSCALS